MKLLVSHIDELKEYLNIPNHFNIDKLSPFIREASNKYLKKAMGPEMYAELLLNYGNSQLDTGAVAMSADMKELHGYCLAALAHLSMYEGSSSFNLTLTDGGATRPETQHAKSAYQYQVEDYKRSRKDQGFRALDDLMEYLDENEDIFTTYKNSATRKALKQSFIQDVAEFSKHRSISESRWIFLLMRPQMDHIAKTRIKSALTEDRYNTIKTELLISLSEENQALMDDYVRPALAHLAFADAIIELALNVDDRGVTVYNTESARGNIIAYKEAPDNYLFNLKNTAEQRGNFYLAQLEAKVKEMDSTELTDGFESKTHLTDQDKGFAAFG